MSRSLPELVVASAAALISSKCSVSHSPNARASRALGNTNDGARCIASSITVVLHAARLAEQLHAAVVAGDERPLGRRQRHVELALGVLAVDQQRARRRRSAPARRR